MAAFRAGIEAGADTLELDVHLSRDGRLVVIHDPILARTTNQSGSVSDYDLATLKSFDATARYFGAMFPRQEIPTLEEVLQLVLSVPDRVLALQVEIKVRKDGSRYEGIEAELVRILRLNHYVEHTTVLSFDFPSLRTIAEIEPGLRTCALAGQQYLAAFGVAGPDAVADAIAALGVDCAGVSEKFLGKLLYNALRGKGLGVGAWTVDDPVRMRELAVLGVDFITSNRPDILVQVFP
jgi:glycerophosphoryl diester phosphodiesterase